MKRNHSERQWLHLFPFNLQSIRHSSVKWNLFGIFEVQLMFLSFSLPLPRFIIITIWKNNFNYCHNSSFISKDYFWMFFRGVASGRDRKREAPEEKDGASERKIRLHNINSNFQENSKTTQHTHSAHASCKQYKLSSGSVRLTNLSTQTNKLSGGWWKLKKKWTMCIWLSPYMRSERTHARTHTPSPLTSQIQRNAHHARYYMSASWAGWQDPGYTAGIATQMPWKWNATKCAARSLIAHRNGVTEREN